MKQILYLTCFFAFVSLELAASAADYSGAGAVLKKVEEGRASAKQPVATDEHATLREAIGEFRKKVAQLAPAEAAKGWLDLVERRNKLVRTPSRGRGMVTMVRAEELLEALPPPSAWKELDQVVTNRPAERPAEQMRRIGLRLLTTTLLQDQAGRMREIRALQEKAKEAGDSSAAYLYQNVLQQLGRAVLEEANDPEAILKVLEHRLASAAGGDNQTLEVPELVPGLGRSRTEQFLRRALAAPDVELRIDSDSETMKLAQQVALEMIDQLKKPQWELVNSIDAVELYEAFEKKFPQPDEATNAPLPGLDIPIFDSGPRRLGDHEKQSARTFYMLGLISRNRAADAIRVAKQLGKGEVYLPQNALRAMERAGYTRALDNFLFELLSQDPTLPYWDEYVQLAAKAEQTERMLKLAQDAAKRQDVSSARKSAIHQTLAKALLAADKVEEGVAELRRLAALEVKPSRRTEYHSAGDLGIALVRLGALLQKSEWIEEGLQTARRSLTNQAEAMAYGANSTAQSLAGILSELKRGPEAETVLTEALYQATAQTARESDGYSAGGSSRSKILTALATVYYRENRHNDVITLLDDAPYWDAPDLANLLESAQVMSGSFGYYLRGQSEALPLGYIALRALAETGRTNEAVKILNAMLDHAPGMDRLYQELIRIESDRALDRLEEIYKRDQFEERPLIWKAHLLLRNKRLEDAEQAARQAISIDPSDGEQGPGDRMRAYAVLAEIRAARGDTREADFLKGAVAAIRLAEQADRYYQAGLLKRAVKMYQDSLNQFADAYCIQSRLAIQLAELGRWDEAEAHYRKAYELMPDSFGRVESHCFGCEKAFEGERAQSLAEKTFSDFAFKNPKKPQVHYLLGYLRAEQGRFADALPHFRTAVKLDPDYLNAWSKIADAAEKAPVSRAERDQAVLNILRLDPLQRHTHRSFSQVSDLAKLWNAVEAAGRLRSVVPTNLYPLRASQAAIKAKSTDTLRMTSRYRMDFGGGRALSPGKAIAQNDFVQVATQLFGGDLDMLDLE